MQTRPGRPLVGIVVVVSAALMLVVVVIVVWLWQIAVVAQGGKGVW